MVKKNLVGFIAGCCIGLSSIALAVPTPSDVEQSNQADQKESISKNYNSCVEKTCMNSEDRDCQDNCKKAAKSQYKSKSFSEDNSD